MTINEKKCLKNFCERKKEEIECIMNVSRDEIMLCDKEFNIIKRNHRFARTLEIKNFLNFFKTISEKRVYKNLELFKTTNEKEFRANLSIKAGVNCLPVPINISKLVDKNKETLGFVICIPDIKSELKTQFLQSSFVSSLKHDLRTPVLAQIMVLKLILENKFGEITNSQKEILNEVLSSCLFLSSITDNLLTKYNKNFDSSNKTKTFCDITKITEEVSESLKYMIIAKKQTIHFHIKSNSDPIIFANKQDIEQMIKNLIINAVDHGNENCDIVLNIETNPDNIKLSFKYSGQKEKEENLSNISEEHLISENRYQKIAYGLNLYISKQIAEAYNGILTMKQNKSGRLVVSVSIPKKLKNYFKQFSVPNLYPAF